MERNLRAKMGYATSCGFLKICLIVVIFFGAIHAQEKKSYRICVPKENFQDCEDMQKNNAPNQITCVKAIDKINCIEMITKDQADFVPLEPEEIYIAHRYQKEGFKVVTEIRSDEFSKRDFRYEPVAVIRKSSGIKSVKDLEGKKSCHTGFGRNAGWKIPFSHLMEKKQLPKYCDEIKAPTPEKDLYAIGNYFSQACAPGIWVPERDKDQELKKKYPQLCSLCENPSTCDKFDKYGGYEGALKCLTIKNADIAWTKMDAVRNFFKLDSTPTPNVPDYNFLCWDGTSQPLTSKDPCSWAKRPWAAYLATSRLTPQQISELQGELTKLRQKGVAEGQSKDKIPSWLGSVLEFGRDDKTQKFDVEFHLEAHIARRTTPLIYLDTGKNYSVTIEKPSCATDSSIKFCVKSEIEKNKCLALALAAIGRRILPKVECVLGTDNLDCIQKVSDGQADLVLLSPKDAYWAERNYLLVPILSELESVGPTEDDKSPFRYALAVIKSSASDQFRNISYLRGKRSCHASINNLAGWNAPLAKLRDLKLIGGQTCGLSIKLSEFFGNKSCVPGVNEVATRMNWLPTKNLCSICAGDGSGPGQAHSNQTVCLDDEAERYYGSQGAIQCLLDDAGDVAFLDHVGLHRKAIPNLGIRPEEIKLLCPNGSSMDVDHYAHCNWGKIPSNQVLTRGGEDFTVSTEDVRLTFLKISDTFRPKGKSSLVFKLFGEYFGNPNLLFDDTSVGLCDFEKVKEFDELITDFDSCTTSSATKNILPSVSLAVLIIFQIFKRML